MPVHARIANCRGHYVNFRVWVFRLYFLDGGINSTYNRETMRIGLVSDTHVPVAAKELPVELMEALRGVDLILHAGDIYDVSVLDDLERIAPVLAARGDDDHGVTARDERVKEKHILKFEGQTLWLAHERPYAPMISHLPTGWWHDRLNPEQDKHGKPDIIIFGHEHRTFDRTIDGVLFFSSGSPTFLHYRYELGTIGMLDIDSDKAEARILQL